MGDLVWATDPETGVAGPRRVVEVYHNRTDTLLHLTLCDRERAEYTYSTTKEHPFWTENRGWVSAGELATGDIVRQLDGQQGEFVASRVEPLGRIIPVYNFQVEGLHTYFVLPVAGETTVTQDLVTNAFLVHNAGDDGCGGRLRDEKGRYAKDPNKPPPPAKSDHGNVAGDQLAYNYKKYDSNGMFLKHGVTQDYNRRYTQSQLNGGKIVPEPQIPRREALRIERDRVETDPGPDNREPWAGKRKS